MIFMILKGASSLIYKLSLPTVLKYAKPKEGDNPPKGVLPF